MSNKESDRAGVLQGTLDVMILQTLATLGPSHGYAIAARIAQVSNGSVRLNMGSLCASSREASCGGSGA